MNEHEPICPVCRWPLTKNDCRMVAGPVVASSVSGAITYQYLIHCRTPEGDRAT